MSAWGHNIPLLKIAQDLIQNCPDYQVEIHAPEITRPMMQESFKKLLVHYIEDKINESNFNSVMKNPAKGSQYILKQMIPQRWEKYFASLQTEYSLIITDLLNITAIEYAKCHKFKLIVNQPISIKKMYSLGEYVNLKSSIGIGGFSVMHPPFYLSLSRWLKGNSGTHLRYNQDSLIIVDSFFGFDQPCLLPPHIKPVGMLEKDDLIEVKDGELCEWILKMKKNHKRFIYLSLGSAIKISQNLARTIREGLISVGLPVIWACRSFQYMNLQHPNFFLREWLPQHQILSLPEVNIFLTHGGWNSLSESICHAKPMAVLAFYADQLENADQIKQNGSGVVLYKNPHPKFQSAYDFPQLTSQMISKGVQQLLTNYDKHKKKVEELRTMNKKNYGLRKVRSIIKDTIEVGYDHLVDRNFAKISKRGSPQTLSIIVLLWIIILMIICIFFDQ